MRECPVCSVSIQGDSCPSCGWGETKAVGGGRVLPSNHWQEHWPPEWNCCHMDRGQRCANPGAFSESVKGGGPFYCKAHYPPFGRRNYGPALAPPSGFRSVYAVLQAREPGEEG